MIIKKCLVHELIEKMKLKKVVCFGTGKDFINRLLDAYSEYNLQNHIDFLMDNSSEKQGTKIQFKNKVWNVVSVDDMLDLIDDDTIVIITSSMYYYDMVNQLNNIPAFDNVECYIWPFIIAEYKENLKLDKIISENMNLAPIIPKVIHWCWFGRGKLPEKEKKCVESWNKYCPDYKIVLWNEDNFDVNSNIYTKEAYEQRKWAFVTDYVRLWALYNYGGIYMDADVEVIKNLDAFLGHSAFSGFETYNIIPTGIIGAKPKNEWIQYLLSYYNDKHFIENGSTQLISNVCVITEMTKNKYGVSLKNEYLNIADTLTMYPMEVFCPMNPATRELKITNNTYCIHRFSTSWSDYADCEKQREDMLKKITL